MNESNITMNAVYQRVLTSISVILWALCIDVLKGDMSNDMCGILGQNIYSYNIALTQLAVQQVDANCGESCGLSWYKKPPEGCDLCGWDPV